MASKFKVGDRVTVTNLYRGDHLQGFSEGMLGVIAQAPGDTTVMLEGFNWWLDEDQVELHEVPAVPLLVEAPRRVRDFNDTPPVPTPPKVTAENLLRDAADVLRDRASARDAEGGERSMARCVEIYRAISGVSLTEEQGWDFMIAIKLARMSQGGFHFDDYVDTIGYAALKAECAANTRLSAP